MSRDTELGNKDEPQFTLRWFAAQPVGMDFAAEYQREMPFWRPAIRNCAGLGLFKLRIALDELLCAASGKADGNAAILVVSFDADDRADSIAWVPDSAAEHGIRVTSALCSWSSERAGASGGGSPSRCSGFLFAAHAAE